MRGISNFYLVLFLFRAIIITTPTSQRGIASQYCCMNQNQPPAIMEDAPTILITVAGFAKVSSAISLQFIAIHSLNQTTAFAFIV